MERMSVHTGDSSTALQEDKALSAQTPAVGGQADPSWSWCKDIPGPAP